MNPTSSTQAQTAQGQQNAAPEENELWRALEEVQDPEFPISVVDMGLIYGLQRMGDRVQVQLTFTAMGCPCMEFIIGDVRERLLQEPGVDDVAIEIAWDPPWTRQRLSKKGIEKLKSWGVTV
ncbi:MAG: metal-sulfur cluster assembly factor [Anaerolineales bacterium]|jgi:metal-sulfur cluster biosynthetic enzyme